MTVLLTVVCAFGQQPTSVSGMTRLEGVLSDRLYYNIPKGVHALDWFESLVEILKADLAFYPEHSSRTQLILGDAYHWIGHLYEEDKQNHEKAWEAYNKSYEHYLLSEYKNSPMINSLDTREHAKFHLLKTAEVLNRKPIFGIQNVKQTSSDKTYRPFEMIDYKKDIDRAIKRTQVPLPRQSCELLLGYP